MKEPIDCAIIFLKCILHCLSPKRQQTCHCTLDLKSLSYFNVINHKHINILNSIYIEVYQFVCFFGKLLEMSVIFGTWCIEIWRQNFRLIVQFFVLTADNILLPLSFSDNVNLLAVKLGMKEHWLKATCLFTEPRPCSTCQSWTAQHRPISTHLCI